MGKHTFTNFEQISISKNTLLMKASRYGRLWALKGLRPESRGDAMCEGALVKEYEIGKNMQHPNIVSYISMENVPEMGGMCIVMEYVEGVTLDLFLKTNPPEEVKEKLIVEIGFTLDYVARQSVVHRDIKPSNIMVTNNGNNIKLLDFGMSDADNFSMLKVPGGSKKYMAPEVFQSDMQVDTRADIYSFGKLLEDFQMKKPTPKIIQKCTEPDRKYRYQNFNEIFFDYRKMRRRSQRTKALLATFFVAAVCTIAAFALGYSYLGGLIFGYKGTKQAPAKLSDEYFEEENNVVTDTNYYEILLPQYGRIFFLNNSAEIPGDIPESEAVDLGLSVKWAPFNVGSDRKSITIIGSLVGYGDTSGHLISEDDQKYYHGNLDKNHDIASAKWGGNWRMPTVDEFNELLNECQWRLVANGPFQPYFIVTGPNGRSIMFAGTGYRIGMNHEGGALASCLWTSSYGKDKNGNTAYCAALSRENIRFIEADIAFGYAVRPVLPK